jgi:isoquinoline 1-oxidoreductase beta subunit
MPGADDTFRVDRRGFLIGGAAATGALLVGVPLLVAGPATAAAAEAVEVTHWIVIQPDDTVVIRIARSELGQGSFTGLAMLVAEELECDWNKVVAEYADVNEHVRRNRIWGAMSTGGSRGIRDSHEYVRKAGVAAREMLLGAAADQWGVPVGELRVAKGVVTHAASGRSTTYGALAPLAAKREVPKDVKLKDPKDWTLVGTSPPRLDIPAKVDGTQIYAADVILPGMVHASVLQCPVHGGKLVRHDASKAQAMRGVKAVVATDEWVAVVADNWWRANQALKAVQVEWDGGKAAAVDSASIRAFMRTGIDATDVPVARKDGDVGAAFAGAAKIVEAEYWAPFLNHATLEPQTATARITADGVEVWVGTQNGEAAIAAASEAAGVPLEKTFVHKMHAGGGFGRRGLTHEYVKQAIRIAQTMPGTPVRLQWSREEDMVQGRFRPVSLVRQRAALDAQGRWVGWQVRQAEPSLAAGLLTQFLKDGIDQIGTRVFSDMPYAVPNYSLEYAMRNTHILLGPWRAVAHTHNPFFRECFVDELAHTVGQDPVAFRRPLLEKRPKDLAVLEAVAKAVGWGTPAPKGLYRGIAVSDSYGSYSAAAVEIAVKDGTVIDVKRVIVALDPGHVVHPDAVKAQIESGAVWALSAAMLEEITVKAGRTEQTNFADYPVLKLAQTPKVEAIVMPSGGFWGGVGEPPMAAIGPALGNAIFAATGKRVRELPLRHAGFSYA